MNSIALILNACPAWFTDEERAELQKDSEEVDRLRKPARKAKERGRESSRKRSILPRAPAEKVH